MIIHFQYGPQFDPRDGTIGLVQLVKRWVVVKSTGDLYHPKQGRFTFESKIRAENVARISDESNPDREECRGLTAQQWWCYPGHFEPAYPVQTPKEK